MNPPHPQPPTPPAPETRARGSDAPPTPHHSPGSGPPPHSPIRPIPPVSAADDQAHDADPVSRWQWPITAALLLTAIGALGWYVAHREEAENRDVAERTLTSIVELKAGQIEAWMRERRGDAAVIGAGPRLEDLLRNPQDQAARTRLQGFLATYREAYDYDLLALFDARGELLLATHPDRLRQFSCVPEHVRGALAAPDTLVTDLHRGAADEPIHLSFLSPVRFRTDGQPPADGLILLVLDPHRFLYPFLQDWPIPSESGEILLVRRDGDEVVCLNDTRHTGTAAMDLRFPARRTEIPAVRAAVNGARGWMTGHSLRGVPVVSVAREIPGTPWILVAELDREELLGPIREDTWKTIIAATLAGVSVLLAIRLLWRRQTLGLLRQELTARRQAETGLRESEEKLRQIIAAAQDAIIMVDPQGLIRLWNDAAVRIFGYSADEALGRNLHHFLAPEAFRDRAEQAFPDFRKTGQGGALGRINELVGRRRNGEEFPIELSVAPLRLGDSWHAVGILRDITARKQAEAALQRSTELLRLVLDTIPQAVFWKDQSSVYLGCNRSFATLAGLPNPDRIVGLTDFDLPWQQAESEAYRADDRQVIASGEAKLHIVETQQTAAGDHLWIDTSKAPLLGPDGRPLGVLGVYDDITQRRRMEEDLRARNEELVRFTYAVSHDLKSPLVTIQTFIGYLEKDLAKGDAARIATDFDFIRKAASKMLTLLEELLQLSRVGRKTNPPEDLPFEEAVRAALDVVAGAIAERRVGIQVAPVPLILRGDRPRLTEIFQNLVDNAVKFMGDQPVPRIEIGAEENGRDWVFHVRDNGLGIDPRHHGKLFGLFEKLHPGTPGSGMGLALVKRIVEVHGGRIWAESEGPGRGATFRFTLAGTRRSPEPPPDPARP